MRAIRLPLPPEVILRINKYMSSPTSTLVKDVPVSTRDWVDYDRCLHLHQQHKYFCYLHKFPTMTVMLNWTSNDYELYFIYVYPSMHYV